MTNQKNQPVLGHQVGAGPFEWNFAYQRKTPSIGSIGIKGSPLSEKRCFHWWTTEAYMISTSATSPTLFFSASHTRPIWENRSSNLRNTWRRWPLGSLSRKVRLRSNRCLGACQVWHQYLKTQIVVQDFFAVIGCHETSAPLRPLDHRLQCMSGPRVVF